jgi:hypothetical protein
MLIFKQAIVDLESQGAEAYVLVCCYVSLLILIDLCY